MFERGLASRLVPIILLASLGGGCGGGERDAPAPRPTSRPNVLFITVDTLRADHLGAYGYPRDTSPNIDALARAGILFRYGIVQWPKTSPSMASLFTSTYGNRNGVMRKTRQKIGREFDLVAEVFDRAGYQTAAVVTNGNLGRKYQFDQGFDHFVEIWQDAPQQEAEAVTGPALTWLEAHARAAPFFMWLHYVDPHARYEPPERFASLFVGDAHYDKAKRAIVHPRSRDRDIGGIPQRANLDDCEEIDYYVAQYDAEIRYVDEQVGRVLRKLDALGLAETTLIVFTADHGESLGDHNYFFEHGRFPYDASSRVPLIMKLPTLATKRDVVEPPVGLLHVVPTLLDAAGLPIPAHAQGRSVLPFLRGEGPGVPKHTFTEAGYERNYQRVIRTAEWKLVYVPDPELRRVMTGAEFELYDVEHDPGEQHNLAADHPAVVADLKQRLFAWMKHAKRGVATPHTEDVELDEATKQSLRALGYLE